MNPAWRRRAHAPILESASAIPGARRGAPFHQPEGNGHDVEPHETRMEVLGEPREAQGFNPMERGVRKAAAAGSKSVRR